MIAGGGSIAPAQVTTGADGQASARYTLGPTVGPNEVAASAVGVDTPVTFRATASAASPTLLSIVSGNGQSAETNGTLSPDYVVRVTDSYDNGVAGVRIGWTIESGGGTLASIQSVTGADGSAAIRFTLGSTAGAHSVVASASELRGAPRVVFTSTAVAPPPPPPPAPPPQTPAAPPSSSPTPPGPSGPTSPPSAPQQSATLRITVSTTGADVDNAMLLSAHNCTNGEPCSSVLGTGVGPNYTVTLNVVPGLYRVLLQDLALNCTVPGTLQTPTISAGDVTDVIFNVTCVAAGVVRVSTTTSGTDLLWAYTVRVDGQFATTLGNSSSSSLGAVSQGSRVISLEVPQACVVVSANPITIIVTPGVTTDVVFDVSCGPHPTLNVTISTSGSNNPSSFWVGIGPPDEENYHYVFQAPANGVASRGIPVGQHYAQIFPLRNCRVTSSSWAIFEMKPGVTTNVAWTVECQ